MSEPLSPASPASNPNPLPPLKSGFLTSTFWMVLAGLAFTAVLALKDKLPATVSGPLLVFLPAFYGAVRHVRASGHEEMNRDLLLRAFDDAGQQLLAPDANGQTKKISDYFPSSPEAMASPGTDGAVRSSLPDLAHGVHNPGPAPASVPPSPTRPVSPSSEPDLPSGMPSRVGIALLISASMFSAGCAATGARLGDARHPAMVHLPANYATLDAKLTPTSFEIHATGVDSAGSFIAQGKAAHDVINGVQGTIISAGTAVATSGLFPGGVPVK